MNRSPAFQFYPDKWQSHTRRLDDQSYRVFHELICWMWQHAEDHCSIPASPEAVACAVAMPLQCVRIAIADIQNEFSPLLKTEDGRWICHGLRKEADKQKIKRTKAKTNADARWKNADASNPQCKPNADASNPQCSPTPTPTPTPSKTQQAVSDKDSEALEIYKAYPLKVNRPSALRSIRAALKTIEAPKLLELVKRFAAARPTGTPYTPHPATWFNGRRYEDDPATWQPTQDNGKSPPPSAASPEFSPGWENKDFWDMTAAEKLRAVKEGNR